MPNAAVVGTAGAQANNLVIGTLNGTGTLTTQNGGHRLGRERRHCRRGIAAGEAVPAANLAS